MAPLLNTNLQAFNLTVSTLLKQPSHFLPNLTIPTFLELPEQIGQHLVSSAPTTEPKNERKIPKIKALILDKDNTLCPPHTTTIPKPYLDKLEQLRTSPTSPFNINTNPDGILIVSNTAGSRPDVQKYVDEAKTLEEKLRDLRIPVFRVQPSTTSSTDGTAGRRKPFCGPDVLAWFRERRVITQPDEVVVVGDRLGTDTLMAAQMGSWSVWCKDGVTHSVTDQPGMDYRGFLAKVEIVLERYLREDRGIKARVPKGWQ
jgi:phosphatidylglycerophosphatase GEP4